MLIVAILASLGGNPHAIHAATDTVGIFEMEAAAVAAVLEAVAETGTTHRDGVRLTIDQASFEDNALSGSTRQGWGTLARLNGVDAHLLPRSPTGECRPAIRCAKALEAVVSLVKTERTAAGGALFTIRHEVQLGTQGSSPIIGADFRVAVNANGQVTKIEHGPHT